MGAANTAPSSPTMSRSNSTSSVLSQSSHKSEPAWYSSYNGVDTTKSRKSSTVSTKTTPASRGDGNSGLKSFFSAEGRAERKEQKRKEQEKLEKTVLTSRHAATVRTRMLLEQHNLRGGPKVANVTGTTKSVHLTAAAQQTRLPHSGPPALHVAVKADNRDMPALSRIMSGDERDEEDERLERDREEWLRKKADVTMRKVTERDGDSDEDEPPTTDGQLLEVDGTRLIGVRMEGQAYTPKPVKLRHGVGAGWSKDSAGVWRR
ncbi:uncharacterized protein HMPREF1541_01531 [Cyphellophora europaea CBS 101466]|uniref:Uncharacterized protein n=1 Tax=Cyphellophora europaea (strain CBS 101466) TaxID=1220924 RepID=W2S148_CYPE1|nr:uncharacterized protein HMPREF1541_01531 [Cyphellophora europaea CBS 101466]ETN42377.1 hypothetical protein HMPREF1541_01531 [Cyphellophora europaea CBS 101466]